MNLAAAAIGAFGVLLGVVFTAAIEGVREAKRARRDKEARQEEYLRRRRDEFERVLADFVPVHKRWAWLIAVSIRQIYAAMSDTDPEPDTAEVDELELQVHRYVAQMRVRSPSEGVTALLDDVTTHMHSLWMARNFVNHISLSGSGDPEEEEAMRNVDDVLSQLDEAVGSLVEVNSVDARSFTP